MSLQLPPVLWQHVCFHSYSMGLLTAQRDRDLFEDVSRQITNWINSQGHAIRVMHLSCTQTNQGAHGTVWYVLNAV